MKKYHAWLTTLALLALSVPAEAQNPEDILVYKFARSRVWQQYQAVPDATGNYRGRNVLAGVSADNSFWVIDRANQKIAEIRYYVQYVDDVKQKLYDTYEYTFTDLGIDPAAYSDNASGNDDQFMDVMTVPTPVAVVKNLSFRNSWTDDDSTPDERWEFGEVWDLVGKTAPVPLVKGGVPLPNVARLLTGFFQGIEKYEGTTYDYYRNRNDAGAQSALLDVVLTLRARTVSVNNQTPNTMLNGVAAAVALVEALGYDYED
ncbi:MAG: hypothetical protein JNK37_03300 [Verrucomicrobiales bacterium]|nr:hypothetical protein [Verrucomicrobiales bacterium]